MTSAPSIIALGDDTLLGVSRGGSGDESPRARGRALLATLVMELTGYDPKLITVTAKCVDCGGDHGRPAATAAGRAVAVSVSHAGGVTVAVASTTAASVGVDAERRVTPTDRVTGAAALLGIDDVDDEAVLRAWTQVEAVLKADGRGLKIDPVDVLIDARTADIRMGSVPSDPRGYRLLDAEGPEIADLIVSVAIESSGTEAGRGRRAIGRRAGRDSTR